ncbi:hypothetical protein FZEAL_1288 [Fusarium zealandicum]|uniref:Uncharacterized protein n=1 Tax=Fusarium zealandicum TaxID=1053134 RepID=A0A8H4XNX9_9HYPO|nr:hypothetical protein FZEAL_1288 [Fusarium zealandicum]
MKGFVWLPSYVRGGHKATVLLSNHRPSFLTSTSYSDLSRRLKLVSTRSSLLQEPPRTALSDPDDYFEPTIRCSVVPATSDAFTGQNGRQAEFASLLAFTFLLLKRPLSFEASTSSQRP